MAFLRIKLNGRLLMRIGNDDSSRYGDQSLEQSLDTTGDVSDHKMKGRQFLPFAVGGPGHGRKCLYPYMRSHPSMSSI